MATVTTTPEGLASLDFAQSLFRRGTECFGLDEVRLLGYEISPDELPPIPLSEKMLKHLRMLDMCLELHGPTTMAELYKKLGNNLDDEGGKLLYNTDRYQNEAFYQTEKSAGWHWRVVTKELVPDTTSKKYLAQTRVLAEYLKGQVFAGQTLPEKFRLAVEELNDREKELAVLVEADWNKGGDQIVSLAINQACRGTAMQSLWGVALYKKVNGDYLLPGVWDWTKSCSADGSLVCVGDAASDGVCVGCAALSYSHLGIGVRFSCRAEDLAG